MAEQQYQRLTRSRSRSVFGIASVARSSLWLGEDHVLRIDSTGYNEYYKRFYFRDIQAIFIRRTRNWIIWAAIFGGLTALFALLAFTSAGVEAAAIFGSVAGIFLLALIFDLAAGPSCACHLRTAVQVEDLPSVNRMRRARKVLDRLRPLIAATQGQLSPEEVSARLSGGSAPVANRAEPSTATDQPVTAQGAAVEEPNSPPQTGS